MNDSAILIFLPFQFSNLDLSKTAFLLRDSLFSNFLPYLACACAIKYTLLGVTQKGLSKESILPLPRHNYSTLLRYGKNPRLLQHTGFNVCAPATKHPHPSPPTNHHPSKGLATRDLSWRIQEHYCGSDDGWSRVVERMEGWVRRTDRAAETLYG